MIVVQIELAVIILLLFAAVGSLEEGFEWIDKDIRKLRRILRYGVRALPLVVRVGFINDRGEKVEKMNVKDSGQAVKLVLAGEDAAGNAAPLDSASAPAYSLDDSSMGSLAPDSDPANALGQVFTPSGKLGAVNIAVSVPAVGSQPALAGSLAVSVVAGDVTQVALSASVIDLAPAAPSA